ncbi:MAG: hypothetical protein E6X49_22540 [Leclercia adecarboxylata]|uniref:hypothetical protein n=1 Tax=Leclercia adecarboxylata TaxID=83655 RepID=UPI002906289C|nr:hypothetical protein [Leclercia adecarboxylata]
MSKFTKEQLVEYVKACIEHAERFPGVEIADKEKAVFEIALAALTAPVFMYAIADPDGEAHFDECCVGQTPGVIEDEVALLNEEMSGGDGPRGVVSDGYRVVALYQLPEVE